MKGILAAIARAFATLGRVTLVPIIEGGRLVWRAVRSAFVQPDPIAEAEAAVEAQAAEPAPAPVALSPAEQWGRAALAHLMGDEPEGNAVLDDAAMAYLDGLNEDQRVALSKHGVGIIGAHLFGERLLPSLPRPPSPAEYRAIEAARAAARYALRVGDEMRDYTLAVLDELIAEPPRAI